MQLSVAFPTVSQPVSITGYIYAKLLACNFYIDSMEHVNSADLGRVTKIVLHFFMMLKAV